MQPPVWKDQSPEKVAARMGATLELHLAGVRMMLVKLPQNHPDETHNQILARLNAWLQRPLSREELNKQTYTQPIGTA